MTSPAPAPAVARRAAPLLVLLVGLGWLVADGAMVAEVQGLTYDEPVYAAVGERHLSWFREIPRRGFGAFSPVVLEAHWGNSGPTAVEADWHPPVGKLLLALGRRVPVPGVFARYRLANVALFGLTGLLLYLWLTPFAGRVAGVAAAVCWLTLPRAVAHGNLAALDLPATCFATAAVIVGWHLVERPSWRRGVGFGVVFAVAMATKFNGLLALPPVVLLALGVNRKALGPLAVGALLVAPVVFWLVWPWLWYDGGRHLMEVIAFHGRHGYIATTYFGTTWGDPPPPWHYAPVMLAITTPLAVLLSAGLGCLTARRRLVAFLVVTLFCHLAPFLLPAAAKYNGVRLFLPALVPLAALSGLGAARAAAWLRARLKLSAEQRWVAPAVALLAVYLPSLVGLLQVYPYPMAYYGALVGGAAGAERRGFEICYWGDPFRECVAWLSRPDVAPPGAVVYLQPPGAIAMVEMYRGIGLLRDDLRLVGGAENAAAARFFVYQNRRSEWDALGEELTRSGPARYTVEAGGAAAAFVWDVGDR